MIERNVNPFLFYVKNNKEFHSKTLHLSSKPQISKKTCADGNGYFYTKTWNLIGETEDPYDIKKKISRKICTDNDQFEHIINDHEKKYLVNILRDNKIYSSLLPPDLVRCHLVHFIL